MDLTWETYSFISKLSDLPPELVHILQYGSNVDYLDALSIAALQPRLTEPVFLHFRPLALDICARWSGRDAQAVAAALGRILETLPHLSEVAQRVLGAYPELDLLANLEVGDVSDRHRTKEVLLAISRLLSYDNAVFASFIRPAKLQAFLLHDQQSIRVLAIRVLCQYLHASDAMFEQMKTKYLSREASYGDWEGRAIDYHFLTLWEEKRLQDFRSKVDLFHSERAGSLPSRAVPRVILSEDVHGSVSVISGMLLLRSDSNAIHMPSRSSLVLTETTTSNLRLIAESLRNPGPLLLTGLAGCGKTSLVKYVAEELGRSTKIVTLHLNEQSDAKLLIGVYTTGDQPGSFKWRPGVLTTAVTEGRWIFIEDLDRAPNEIISTLLPLIERGELYISNRGEKVQAASGFRIIATMRSTRNMDGQIVTPGLNRMLGRRLWKQIPLEQPYSAELQQIIKIRHTILSGFLPRIMAAYHNLLSATTRDHKSLGAQQLRSRPISSRELFKWTVRIDLILKANGMRTGAEIIPEPALDAIFLDGLDCFVNHLEDQQFRNSLIAEIAKELHIDPQRRDHVLDHRAIVMQRSSGASRDADVITIGRTWISRMPKVTKQRTRAESTFVLNHHSLKVLEQIAVAVRHKEPLLLVGETGIGKTAAIQYLSHSVGQELVAINMSQQSESGDLLGGFKPVNIRSLAIPLKDEFDTLFDAVFSSKNSAEFSVQLGKAISKSHWKRAVSLWRAALQTLAKAKVNRAENHPAKTSSSEQQIKRRKLDPLKGVMFSKMEKFSEKLDLFERQLSGPPNTFRFAFAESKMVEAVREGYWVLLDEINLASSDTLECLSDLLDTGPQARPFLVLTEAGSVERIEAHPDFRLFAAMNPASDVGKKDLPVGIRSRFTEIYINSPDGDTHSLKPIVQKYLERFGRGSTDAHLSAVVTDVYQTIQRLVVEEGLVDGSGNRPHFSLRTLTRALSHAVAVAPQCSLHRALYEGFCMCFFTMLDPVSESRVKSIVQAALLGDPKVARAHLRKSLRSPSNTETYVEVLLRVETLEDSKRVQEESHWLPKGKGVVEDSDRYIITPYVAHNIRNLIRATSGRKHPVLIQGPTSAGKTSMVEYLAKRSGNRFVRINNHEHTDLQEYLGTYISTSEGQLVFQEGVLVQALREGHWVVLDELNLAPTDVLEALNRLLDDNRELLIPETQEVIKPHRDFMLFATQNPAGPYGGRKTLSRAFRNRFIELHFDDIPVGELNVILARRSDLPESWCALIVEVYNRLSTLRQEQRLFEQNSFATLRDLFRWAFRGADTVEHLAYNGYMLLAEKVRKEEERKNIRDVITQVMSRKGVNINIDESLLYNAHTCPEMVLYNQSSSEVIWTKAMKRLYCLVAYAIRNNEPVLLVGETGCGKTTVCQMLAHALQKHLHVVNAHQNTETGDLIGAQRPVRNRGGIENELLADLEVWRNHYYTGEVANVDISGLLAAFDQQSKVEFSALPPSLVSRIAVNRRKRKALFEWADGSLVQAMRSGQFYLLDEISLAEDSVLERMNSVLDPQRSLLLAEKGSDDSDVIASEGFQFLATMNPGGDYGKKELSPALRNRFTEIWVPPLSDYEDIVLIAEAKLTPEVRPYASAMVAFAKWFGERFNPLKTSSISIRDILAWVEFANKSLLQPLETVVQGASMVFIDALGANPSSLTTIGSRGLKHERGACLRELGILVKASAEAIYHQYIEIEQTDSSLRVGSFVIPAVQSAMVDTVFDFEAPTVKQNALRILRALQVRKPVLLEGNPGVGKTSIIVAIAKASGKRLIRINLSEQTDLMDLFGSDVPVEDGKVGMFAWKDAPFLQAMKRGDWVLLDEMNLASQSILEGLNACLDHRGEVYVSELDQTFARHPDFKLFAAQNPHHQGGGRKGLPASFVNRFTVVYADVYSQVDLELICTRLFPLEAQVGHVRKAIAFVSELDEQVVLQQKFGAKGSPWEFNLRDTIRFLQLSTSASGLLPAGSAKDFLDVLFVQRFRSVDDVRHLRALFELHFEEKLQDRKYHFSLSPNVCQVGLGLLPRSSLLHHATWFRGYDMSQRFPLFESLMICVQQSWPVILVGASGVGKSAVLQALASLTGAEIEIFALNADIDATDLVGGYEQADISRQRHSFLTSLARFCREETAKHLVNQYDLSDADACTALLLEILTYVQAWGAKSGSLEPVLSVLEQYAAATHSQQVETMLSRCRFVMSATTVVQMDRFEWVDGILVKALEEGKWLVLDNANLCSSSVLDRLNSLLEPEGALIVNEHCSEDGNPKIVRPHPNFRIFMTMDPQYGEMSRAMRNRAVELYISPLEPVSGERDSSKMLPESKVARFRQLIDTISSPSFDEFPELAQPLMQLTLDTLSSEDLHLLPRLLPEIETGLMSPTSRNATMVAAGRYEVAGDLEASFAAPTSAFYNLVASELQVSHVFATDQPTHPLSNVQLVRYAQARSLQPSPEWLGNLREIILSVVDMKTRLEKIKDNASSSLVAMTRLERSMAAGRIQDMGKESTRYVGIFLEQTRCFILEWLRWQQGQKLHDAASFNFIRNLARFWWHLHDLTNSTSFDETLFQTYLSLWRDLVSAAVSSDFLSYDLGQNLAKIMNKLASSASLTTGLSMEAMWKVFKPAVPPTFDRFQALLQFKALADRFRQSIWHLRVPMPQLLALYRSLADGCEKVLSLDWDVRPLIRNLEQAIVDLGRNVESEAAVDPFFGPIFDGLSRLRRLSGNTDDELDYLELLARGTNHVGNRRGCIEGPAYQLQSISATFQNDLYLDGTTLFEDQLPVALLRRLRKVDEVDLQRLPLLQLEMVQMGIYISTNTNLLSSDISQMLLERSCALATTLVDIHNDPTLGPIPERVQTLLRNIRRVGRGLGDVAKKPLNELQRWRMAGESFAIVACSSLELYVPDRSFDPALRSLVSRTFHEKQLNTLECKLRAISLFERTGHGDSTSVRHESLQTDLLKLGSLPDTVKVARPPDSRLNDLQVEFDGLLRAVQTIEQGLGDEGLRSSQHAAWSESLASIASRLEDDFADYRDIVTPAVCFVRLLRLGLNLMTRAPTSDREQSRSPRFQTPTDVRIIPLTGLHTHPSVAQTPEIPTRCLSYKYALEVHKLMASIVPPVSWPHDLITEVVDEFDRLHGRWQSQVEKERKKHEVASNLYKYKGSLEEEDEALGDDFGALFPSFDNDEERPDRKDYSELQISASYAADSHMSIFLATSNPESQLENMMMNAADQRPCAGGSQDDNNQAVPSSEDTRSDNIMPSLFFLLNEQRRALQSEIRKDSTFNIYTDSNIAELKRTTAVVYQVQDHFKILVEAWPDHSTLHNVLGACGELLSCRHTDPLMKILPKIERLHAYVYEWQTVASREFSAVNVLNLLTELIISWRQLELSTWAKLLDLEDERCANEAKSFWFLAYGNVNLPEMRNHSAELLEVLQGLLAAAPIGQFSHRLRMLRSLVGQMAIESSGKSDNSTSTALATSLVNFCNYFSRFETSVARAIADGRKILEKSVKEVLQLASWKDRNIESLRQSAKISHRKLFRIVKKYREQLEKPVTPLISVEAPLVTIWKGETPFCPNAIPQVPNEAALKVCESKASLWLSRPARYQNLPATTALVESKLTLRARGPDASSRLEDFVDSLEASMSHLQKATPQTLTEENMAAAKHLTASKRRLFADTLKDLRHMGLKSNPTLGTVARQSSLGATLSSMPALSADLMKELLFQEGEDSLHRTLDLMSQVRLASKAHHEDLTTGEITRCVGFAESTLALCLQQRDLLANVSMALATLDSCVRRVENTWSVRGCHVAKEEASFVYEARSLETKITWLPTVMRVAAKVLAAQGELGSLSWDELVNGLRRIADDFNSLLQQFRSLPAVPLRLISAEHVQWANDSSELLRSSTQALRHWMEQFPHSKITLEHVLYWTDAESHARPLEAENGTISMTLPDFELTQFEGLNAILGSVQDVESALEVQGSAHDVKDWLVCDMRNQGTTINAFHISNIVASIQGLLSRLHEVQDGNPECLSDATASLTVTLPLVQQYRHGLQTTILRYIALYRATCRAAYRLIKAFTVLANQGFCKPAEKSGDKSTAEEKTESGTGLGEGEGAEDISKDIGDDEDLSELAQDQNNQTTEREIENEDDAVDIEDSLEGVAGQDMADGEMEDEEDKEAADSDDDAEAKSETGSVGGGEGGADDKAGEAAEDEVGDVDDLGPSTVDEKMWDQAGEEENQELKGKQSANDTNGDENAAAGEKGREQDEEGLKEQRSGEDGVMDEDSDLDLSDVDNDEAGAGQEENMDPQVKESEGLELPDDIQLDGEKGKQGSEEEEDLDQGQMKEADIPDEFENRNDEQQEDEDVDIEGAQIDKGQGDQQDEEPVSDETAQEHQQQQVVKENDENHVYGTEDAAEQDEELGTGVSTGRAEQTKEEDESMEAQGVGPDEARDDLDPSSSNAQRDSGQESRSAQATQATNLESSRQNPEPITRENRDQQAIRKLGDVLEKWHRQQREIHPANDQEQRDQESRQQEDAVTTGAEFEHLPDEHAEADTQALGAATKDQAKALDQSMAADVDDQGEQKLPDDIRPENADDMMEEDEAEDLEMHDKPVEDTESQEQEIKQASAFMGQRQEQAPTDPQTVPDVEDMDQDMTDSPPPSTLDEDLTTMSLATRPPSPSSTITSDPTTLWNRYTHATSALSQTLTEQLRLILAPTLATKLRGDFRTGKRLNIKRIIPYIASSYRRDKIWMRRSVPSKRAYQVMLAIDDSGSMGERVASPHATTNTGAGIGLGTGHGHNNTGDATTPPTRADLAFSTLALLTTSLTSLEIPAISILGFGAEPFIAHPFSSPFSTSSGPGVLGQFSFAQRRTDVRKLLHKAVEVFVEARAGGGGAGGGGEELWQLMLIVGDGICEDHEGVRRELVRAREERILVVFVVVDDVAGPASSASASASAPRRGQTQGQSITDLERVEFVSTVGEDGEEGDMKIERKKYLETFPFEYYLIVRDVTELPGVLAMALRQWFAEVAER